MKDYLAKWEREKHEILQSSNTLEEKMEYINEEEQYMDDYKDDIEAWESVRHFVDFLYNILDEGEYAYHWEKDGKRVLSYEPDVVEVRDAEPDKYLYVGIEPQTHKDITEMTEEDRKDWI